MLSRHRQGGDKHGDTAQHEHGPHQAAHASQKDGPEPIKGERVKLNVFKLNFKAVRHHHLARASNSYRCLCSSRTSNQMLQRITPHASAMAKAHGILGTLFEGEEIIYG